MRSEISYRFWLKYVCFVQYLEGFFIFIFIFSRELVSSHCHILLLRDYTYGSFYQTSERLYV